MGKINRENIEYYIIDYIEGNLDTSTRDEVQAFLVLNPDIAEDVNGLEDVHLDAPEIRFDDKSALKETISKDEFENKCIEAIENNLDKTELKTFSEEVNSNKHKRNIFRLYEHTIVAPDMSVVFDNKEDLKKRTAVKRMPWAKISVAAAAVLLISVSVALLWNNRQHNVVNGNNDIAHIVSKQRIQPVAPVVKKEVKKHIKVQHAEINKDVDVISQNTSRKIDVTTVRKEMVKSDIIEVNSTPKIQAVSSIFEKIEPKDFIETNNSIANEMALNTNAQVWQDNTENTVSETEKNSKVTTIIDFNNPQIKGILGKIIKTKKIRHEKIVTAEQKDER